MELLRPRLDGAAATKAIEQQYPGVEVVALTGLGEAERVQWRCRLAPPGTGRKDLHPSA
jgi:hypothetical protein